MTKPIWFSRVDLDALNARHAGDINGHLGIEMTDYGPDWLEGRMPVDARTRQPRGILHGGASVVLAETLASAAANLCVDPEAAHCVGQEVNANHLRAVAHGYVKGVAKPVHLGRTSQVWSIEISDEQGRPTCVSRLTIAVVPRRG
ncbi:hotdog fold thioesterase [Phenylobacterium sp.]|uniref:hotdog fold thioesterase n=1 Tax=Phenylobacterium sp. TaxID=1871053 RepID=UPI00122501FB|nr:hotdog fold thioesterase [Phenylobacterium sp.]THD52138.1 MAG: hotdog fold thioesterase [Phenylobacterium sp.]